MKKTIFTFTLLFGLGLTLFAQKSKKEISGDKFYDEYSFDKAIDSYVAAKDLSIEGQRKLADAYHHIDRNKESEIVYSKFINNSSGVPADDYYSYAMVLKTNGKYDQAAKWMDKFKELKPNDLRAKNYAANNSELTNLQKDQGKYKITHLDINTDAEDFGTCYYKNKIVFASSREVGKLIKREYNWNRKPFLDMYVADVADDQLKNPQDFSKELNGKMHDGPASFSNDGNSMAFTRNNYTDQSKDGVVKLQIYFSNFKDKKWTAPEAFYLNSSEYSVGHPCLTADGNTMYFVSDMPGGFGGADIYKITKDDKGKWGKPENLGDKINTEGDEMFPFFEENSGALFFASNGRLGLGGLDNFGCFLNGDKFGKVYNFGYPVNTQYDDFALIINDKFAKGYFTSNRVGGAGDDDIYSYELLKGLEMGKKLKGVAKDKAGNPIPNTFIQLLDEQGNVIDTLTTKDDGSYTFLVDSDKKFKLIGTRPKYIDGDSVTNTFGKDIVVKADIILTKKEEMVARKVTIADEIKVGADLGKILQINPIYYDLNKYDIRPDAKLELDKIVSIMNEYPDMEIELGSHTDCRASMAYNQALSDNRAKAAAAYVKSKITKPQRIYGKGYGETRLVNGCACEGTVVSDCPEEEHAKNRRTEFIIVKK